MLLHFSLSRREHGLSTRSGNKHYIRPSFVFVLSGDGLKGFSISKRINEFSESLIGAMHLHCVCLLNVCVFPSFLSSWVWSSSWSWLPAFLPSSSRTGSKTSSTYSSTIMLKLTVTTSTCRISSISPRNMWVSNSSVWSSRQRCPCEVSPHCKQDE